MERRLDVVSLIAGIVFVMVGLGQLLGLDLARLTPWRWWPVLLVIAGIVALVGRSRTTDDD